jgi:outer membrane protein assembly factor BamB
MRWNRLLPVSLVWLAGSGLLTQSAATAAAPAEAATPAGKAATTTAIRASAAASKYDSWVTFVVHVTSRAGTPTGSVTFTDASNGSILDTATLSRGAARLRTAALSPGIRSVVARYGGSSAFRASTSAASRLRVAAVGSDATAYQIDPRHDGNQPRGHLNVRSLRKKWTVTLGQPNGFGGSASVSYPVVAGGRVFVAVPNTSGFVGSSRRSLFALNARTGKIDWSRKNPGYAGPFSAVAYDGRRVFAMAGGYLFAYAASSGRKLWSAPVPGNSPPSAYDGVVYIGDGGYTALVSAVSEADGVVRWSGPGTGEGSAPAVDDSGAYVSNVCHQDYRFSLSGRQVWHYQTNCGGGGSSTPALHGRYAYTRGFLDLPLILSKASGKARGSFLSDTVPAFSGTGMYTIQYGRLYAGGLLGGAGRWSFGNGSLDTAPIVSRGVVFVGASDGLVYGVSARTGRKVWMGSVGTQIGGSDLVGLAIGGGLLVVPAGPELVAFGG